MINIIVAAGLKGEIGRDNKLLWHLKDDLINFKKLTITKIIIMGRKTFESLPGVLCDRYHIVITNRASMKTSTVEFTNNIENIIKLYQNSEEEVFVIGGAKIYKIFEPYCNKIYYTQVKSRFDKADVFFKFDENKFKTIDTTNFYKNKDNEYDFVIYELLRKK